MSKNEDKKEPKKPELNQDDFADYGDFIKAKKELEAKKKEK